MARFNPHQLAYTAIRIEGGLIPAEELSRLTTLAQPEATEQTEASYSTPRGLKLRDEIARYFKIAQNLWQEFQNLRQRQDVDPHTVTINTFLISLFRDSLGYTDLARSAGITSGDHTYQIGHAALGGRLPVVLAGHDHPLDQAQERFGDTNPDTGRTRRRSVFMLAQEALNASDTSLWAVVSNGLKLRILRDNPSLTRPAYIEVDLEAIFTEELYADFTAFWLLAHASRFGTATSEPTDCAWERWRNAGQQAGVTVRMNLRYQVAEALKALGTGFLSHPANTHLREQLQDQERGSATKQAFFEELLRLVYRFIFLATVEDRIDPTSGQSLIFTPDATDEARQRYRAGYSLTWLRERAARASSFDTHSDLWQALSITFDGLAVGQPALGLPALGGLFAQDQLQILAHAEIENRHLLAAVFQLGYFRQPTGLNQNAIPLSGYLWTLLRGEGAVNADIDSAADHVCRTHSVFHWWLAFPQVAAKGGFSVMLGNPPWERIKLQEEEFFATRSPLGAVSLAWPFPACCGHRTSALGRNVSPTSSGWMSSMACC